MRGSESLSRFLPTFQWSTTASIQVEGSPENILRVLLHESRAHPVAAFLIRLRGLSPHGSLSEFFSHHGFLQLERTKEQVVFGLIGRPWRPGGDLVPMHDIGQWRAFDSESHARMIIAFQVDQLLDGLMKLSTETRIYVGGETARRKFALYWFLVRPFSNLIRRFWLRRVRSVLRERIRGGD